MTDDWIKQERDHEYRIADLKFKDQYRKREAWNTRIGYIASAVAAIFIAVIVIIPIYLWNVDSAKRTHEIETACLASGGTWTSVGGGTEMCVHIVEGSNG